MTVLTPYDLFILSPYKVLGKREKFKFLYPSVFVCLFVVVVLAVHLKTCYTDLET